MRYALKFINTYSVTDLYCMLRVHRNVAVDCKSPECSAEDLTLETGAFACFLP